MDDPDLAARERLSQAVKAWMERANVNPTDLHKRTAVSRDVVYRLLNGQGFPTIGNLIAIATELGTDAASLLAGVMPAAVVSALPDDRPRSLEARVAALERQMETALEVAENALALARQMQPPSEQGGTL